MKTLVSLLVMLCLLAAGIAVWLGRSSETALSASPALESFIDPDVQGFAEVAEGAPLRFPADHGVHPGFRSELWNLFGHLIDARGIRYDFHLNLTRLALDLAAVKSPIAFADLALLGRDTGALDLAAYLLPRLSVTGTLGLDGKPRPVQGHAWLDRAWGAIPTSGGQVGLNRFAIQLDNARELICLHLRRDDGTGTPIPACALIRADGRVQSFQRREIQLESTARWRSPRTGSTYPAAWQLSIPILDLELDLRALA